MHACLSRASVWSAQVEPVTSGYRVTLTYELTAEKADIIRVGDDGVQVRACHLPAEETQRMFCRQPKCHSMAAIQANHY